MGIESFGIVSSPVTDAAEDNPHSTVVAIRDVVEGCAARTVARRFVGTGKSDKCVQPQPSGSRVAICLSSSVYVVQSGHTLALPGVQNCAALECPIELASATNGQPVVVVRSLRRTSRSAHQMPLCRRRLQFRCSLNFFPSILRESICKLSNWRQAVVARGSSEKNHR